MAYKKILPDCRYCEQPIEDATCYCVDLDCEWDTLLHEECYKKVRDAIKVEPIRDLLDDVVMRITTPEKELLPDWDMFRDTLMDLEEMENDIRRARES